MGNGCVMITGIPSCGKTVLLAVLSLRFGLKPKSPSAQNFRDVAEDTLENGMWPPPTNPLEQKTPMIWSAEIGGHPYLLWNCDVAGEEWRTFVAENMMPEEKSTSKKLFGKLVKLRSELSSQELSRLTDLESQFRTAPALCLLIDLADDLNFGKNRDQRNFVEATLTYLEKIDRKKCPIALVVTKCNTYGPESEWRPLLEKNYFPLLKNWPQSSWRVIFTDAVADTTTDAEGKLIPAKRFSSIGLENLLGWIANAYDRQSLMRSFLYVILSFAVLVGLLILWWYLPPYLIVLAAVILAVIVSKLKKS